jgi:diguanylate cyclase (GGDEF)-like protein/PAS domain S-box-containing protein
VPGATLAWQDRFVVSGRYVLADERGPVGTSVVETLVPALDSLSQDNVRLGTTGEVGLCARIGERLGCFPQRRNPRVYFTPLSIGGSPFPMARAVAAESGVLVAEDYRRHYAMAAYGPVGPYGLGMVVKIDTAEVYGPLRERLRIILAMLFALVAAGTWLLRAAVRPLAERLAHSENVAREQYRALEATMMNVADGMMLMDRDGTIRLWNRSAEKLFGYSASEVIGGNVSMLVPESLREKNIAATRRFLATGESGVLGQPNVSYPARRKDGSLFELEFTLTEVPHDGGARLVAVFRDISERKRAEERLTQLALFDDLTGLANRVSFNRRLQDAIARRRRSEDLLAVLYLDLDKLKPVNDTLGHDAGDALLVAFAKRLTAAVRETDLVARLGGDEFGIVMEGLKAPENATSVVNKIFLSLRDPVEIGGNRLVASTSIGIALYRSGDTRETLMKRADSALYEAKGAGRGRHRFAA